MSKLIEAERKVPGAYGDETGAHPSWMTFKRGGLVTPGRPLGNRGITYSLRGPRGGNEVRKG